MKLAPRAPSTTPRLTAFGISFLTPGFFVALAMLVVIGIMLKARVPTLIAKALDGAHRGYPPAARRSRHACAPRRRSCVTNMPRRPSRPTRTSPPSRQQAEKQAADIVEQGQADATALIDRHKALSADEDRRSRARCGRGACAPGRRRGCRRCHARTDRQEPDEAADLKLVDQAIAGILSCSPTCRLAGDDSADRTL